MNPQIGFLVNQALNYLRSGNLQSAEPLLKQAIKIAPKNPDVLRLLGVLEGQKENYIESLEYLKKASDLSPKNGIILSNIGNVLQTLKQYDKAIEAYQKAIKLNPGYAEVYSNLGNTLHAMKQYEAALISHHKAISINPSYAEAHSNLGNTLFALKRTDEALKAHQNAISIKPNYAEAHNNRGNILKFHKDYPEALAEFNIALHLNPKFTKALLNKASLFQELKRYDEAIQCAEEAILLEPNLSDAWANKASSLHLQGRFEEALAFYQKAISLDPAIENIPGYLLAIKMRLGSWNNIEDEVYELISRVSNGEKVVDPFILMSLTDSPFLNLMAAKRWIANNNDNYFKMVTPSIKKNSQKKIRVGYFSADFKHHPVSYLTAELFETHDRNKFELFAFSLEEAPEGDEMRARLRKTFDHFIDAQDKTDEGIAKLARDLKIDIAIDLGGHTAFARSGIFAYRAAPIQVNYLGYPGTIGAEYMDYIIADKTVIPEASQQFYVEKIVYLPNSFMPDDSMRAPSKELFTRADFNLPANKIVFCCFNNSNKFNKKLISSWGNILSRVDNSVLWISENNSTFKNNLCGEFLKLGISPDRIIFAGRLTSMSDHLARYRLADIFLDTHPYNAHTTAMDALKTGVPIITMLGEAFHARVAASLLNTVNLTELITNSKTDYEALAISLAENPEKLNEIKERLLQNLTKSPLFDTNLYSRNLEKAYQKMYSNYQAGLETSHLYLE